MAADKRRREPQCIARKTTERGRTAPPERCKLRGTVPVPDQHGRYVCMNHHTAGYLPFDMSTEVHQDEKQRERNRRILEET